MAIFVDIHAIQSVGPNNLNRDLSGSPKTATFGGVRRARVSSQSWKRAMRTDFRDRYKPENMGVRTLRVVKLMSEEIAEQRPDLEGESVSLALEVFKAAGIKLDVPRAKKGETPPVEDMVSKYLLFLSSSQVEAAAASAIELYEKGGLEAVGKAKKRLKADLKGDLSIDLALFGRMVADDADLNVDASCQVAHALSTHQTGTEFDFFTAVDDEKERSDDTDAGAGMMGTIEFNSATLYRYATINASALARQLGSIEATSQAIGGFVDVFTTSMPTGKQNTFAAHSLPSTVVVSVRDDRPMSWTGAFERPVTHRLHPDAPVDGYVEESMRRMFSHAAAIDSAYGSPKVEPLVLLAGNEVDVVDALPSAHLVENLAELTTLTRDTVEQLLEQA